MTDRGDSTRLLNTSRLAEPTLVLGATLAAAVGATQTVSLPTAGALAGVVVLAAVVAWFDVLGVAVILTAALPWLVVTSDVLPRLTLTFAAGATAAAILVVAAPKSDGSHASLLLRIGIVLFFAPVVISVAQQGLHAGAIQAAKYVVFPIMALVVADASNTRDVARLRNVALWSSTIAIAVNLALGFAGINKLYYGSGEILGLGSDKDLALLAGCVAVAGLASPLTLVWIPVVAVGSIATVATGVRSTLPGLALAVLVKMLAAGVRLRVITVTALAVIAVFVSGASGVVEARFHHGESVGEFQSFSNLGSGRGSIYKAAFNGWWHSSPVHWVIGTGLRTIPNFTKENLGGAYVGHSDVVEVGVQLGIAGLIGLLLIWSMIFARARSRLLLLVLVSFALFNGVLEYAGPLVIGLLLTTGLTRRGELASVVRRRGHTQRAHAPLSIRTRAEGYL
jgi:hypothetical protein